MTRRITLAFVATVLLALVLAGAGTLAIASARARVATERDLRRQVHEVAGRLAALAFAPPDAEDAELAPDDIVERRLRAARLVARVISLDDLGVVTYGPQNVQGELPKRLPGGSFDVRAVPQRLTTVVSTRRLVVVAEAVPISPRVTAVVVGARAPRTGLAAARSWFVIASILTLLVAALVAVVLGRRLGNPVRQAAAAARQMATGQLDVRLAAPTRSGDELAELTESLNTLAANLQRSRAVEQQFLLSVSHDLRTPLTSIRGYGEALADGRGDPSKAGAVVVAEARRLERLVADLLDLAKLQARSFSFRPTNVELRSLAIAMVEASVPDAAERSVAVTLVDHAPAAAVWVTADADRLAQIVSNLIDNAIRYARSQIEVDVTSGGVLTVDDDGPGIPDDDLDRVFERLYVARHALERRESGSGLGLAIVKELTEAMGGRVSVGRSPLGGARFSVALPAQTAMQKLPPPVAGPS